jgi:hypothetical protein
MASSSEVYWPPELARKVASPKAILLKQAEALDEFSGGLLRGDIVTGLDTDKKNVFLSLDIIAPRLESGRRRILTAWHEVGMPYPVTVDADCFRRKGSLPSYEAIAQTLTGQAEGKKLPEASSDAEFRRLVAEVLTSDEVKAIGQSLIALSEDAIADGGVPTSEATTPEHDGTE